MIQQLETRQVLALSAALRVLAPADRILPIGASTRLALAIAFEQVERVRLSVERRKAGIISGLTGGRHSIDPAIEPDVFREFAKQWEDVLDEPVDFEFEPLPREDLAQFVLPVPHLAALLPLVR